MSKAKKNIDGRRNNGQHPNSIATLKEHAAPPFPPGVSGNPGGRQKPIHDDLRQLLMEKHPNDKEGRSRLRIMNMGVVSRAGKDASMFREIRDMVDGPITKQISGPDGGSIPVKMTIQELDEHLADILGKIEDR